MRDVDYVCGVDRGSWRGLHRRNVSRRRESLRRHGRLIADDDRFHVHICDKHSSEKESGSELQRSRVEHVSEKFSHFG